LFSGVNVANGGVIRNCTITLNGQKGYGCGGSNNLIEVKEGEGEKKERERGGRRGEGGEKGTRGWERRGKSKIN
jgi:hypothetical protein